MANKHQKKVVRSDSGMDTILTVCGVRQDKRYSFYERTNTSITIYDYDVNKRYFFYGHEVVSSEIVNHGKGQYEIYTKFN